MTLVSGIRIAVLVLTTAVAVDAQDFRGLNWGASATDVFSKEGRVPDDYDNGHNRVSYNVYLATIRAKAVYLFEVVHGDMKLINGGYDVTAEHATLTGYLEDFSAILAGVTGKYGKPDTDRIKWEGHSTKDYKPEDLALAVSLGQAERWVEWNTPKTNIVLVFGGARKDSIMLIYASREYLDRYKRNTSAF